MRYEAEYTYIDDSVSPPKEVIEPAVWYVADDPTLSAELDLHPILDDDTVDQSAYFKKAEESPKKLRMAVGTQERLIMCAFFERPV